MRVREALSNSRRLAALVAVPVVVVDQLTKRWAVEVLPGHPIEVIPGLLDFRFAENTGSAFSLFQNGGQLLAVAAILAWFLIMYMAGSAAGRLEAVSLGLIMGGAIGNLVDRIFRGDGIFDGPVVDWIDLPNFPTFNLADSAITVGAVLLAWAAYRQK